MNPFIRGVLAPALAILLAVGFTLWRGAREARWVEHLATEGGGAPERDSKSPTGYVDQARAFVAPHERGETYRWIMDVQANEPMTGTRSPLLDTGLEPRQNLDPRIYTLWLRVVTDIIAIVQRIDRAIAAERCATWEPIVTQVLFLVVAAGFMWRRHGPWPAAAIALFIALHPLLSSQFLPGVLTPRTGAIIFCTAACAVSLGSRRTDRYLAALFTAGSLVLDPAWGFPCAIVLTVVEVIRLRSGHQEVHHLLPTLLCTFVVSLAWILDASPLALSAGELRYVHPWYAAAILGLGLTTSGLTNAPRTRLRMGCLISGITILAVAAWIQISHGYRGWLYLGAALGRIHSLDETIRASTLLEWIQQVPVLTSGLLFLPLACVTLVIISYAVRSAAPFRETAFARALLWFLLLSLAFFRIRWSAVALLVALPLLFKVLPQLSITFRRAVGLGLAIAISSLALAWTILPATLRAKTGQEALSAGDVSALLYRQFAHRLARQVDRSAAVVLAPPDLSDSLLFHANLRVALSSAWETYSGQVAASRILSSVDSSEAEAIAQSRHLTHLVVPTWDPVFAKWVQSPKAGEVQPLLVRLGRWAVPPFLRPIPYALPPAPGLEGQTLAVFAFTPNQEESLLLSRLTEYFVEMNEPERARRVAQVLTDVYPEDPNARIARAILATHEKLSTALAKEAEMIERGVKEGRSLGNWDRRVQQAILLAIAKKHDVARAEAEACIREAQAEDVHALNPIEARNFVRLIKAYRLQDLNTGFLLLLERQARD